MSDCYSSLACACGRCAWVNSKAWLDPGTQLWVLDAAHLWYAVFSPKRGDLNEASSMFVLTGYFSSKAMLTQHVACVQQAEPPTRGKHGTFADRWPKQGCSGLGLWPTSQAQSIFVAFGKSLSGVLRSRCFETWMNWSFGSDVWLPVAEVRGLQPEDLAFVSNKSQAYTEAQALY